MFTANFKIKRIWPQWPFGRSPAAEHHPAFCCPTEQFLCSFWSPSSSGLSSESCKIFPWTANRRHLILIPRPIPNWTSQCSPSTSNRRGRNLNDPMAGLLLLNQLQLFVFQNNFFVHFHLHRLPDYHPSPIKVFWVA